MGIHLTALRVSPVTLSKGLCTHFHKSSSQRRLWQLQLRLVNLRMCFMHFNYSRQRESASFLDLDLVNSLAFHFRTTILPQKEMIKDMLGRLREFHMKFLAEHS